MAKKKGDEKVNQTPQSDNEEQNFDEEPNFEDPEGFVDDITDEELLADLLEQKPKESDGYENVIIVDGCPQVGPERLEKLQSVINKIFSKFGKIVNEYYPTTETGVTTGYIFLEYSNPQNAAEAVQATNNCKLDKQHTFLVNLFTDFKKYSDIPKEWEPPAPQPFKVQSDLQWYLMDPDAYDQFLVGIGTGVALQVWQNTLPEPIVLQERPNWTETYAVWSPLGTYLATFHWRGVALWAGPKFSQFQKFYHPEARFISFSPCENYIVTFSPNSDRGDDKKLIIWDIRTGQEKRSFPPPEEYVTWPIFRWSKDDRFFARLGADMLSVYETPSFGLLDKKSIKIPGIRDFSWSPTDNVLAYWVAEDKDVPARVTLLELPNRTEIRSKNLFSVADCKIHWQKSGDYLCVKVDRYSKVKKDKNEIKYSGMYYNFEIFHMREKEIPVDSVEIKEPIQAFAWEPIGSKFSIIHGDAANNCISFYQVNTGQAPTLLKKLDRTFNHLFWSPMGQFIVLANLGLTGGALAFVDTNDFTIMNISDHYQVSGIEWDPTGRYVVTGVSSLKCKMDCGYYLWSFQGKIIRRVMKEGFAQFLWRPRPPTLLSEKQQKEIKKNLKKYYSQFESKDRMRSSKASKELVAKRTEQMKKYVEYRELKAREWAEQKPRRLELRNYVDTDGLDTDPTNTVEEVIEFFIKEEQTVIE
ncbi:eukaryotic translation initiation factor 3 subunit B [Vanessa tameamea]|uniref:Eukaryotic translation initiation factor 3 subunit B n=93 Tax=Pancrustacea TaxID=197562 RepID=A0A8B8IPA3_VANTA|nr:eukaryotic translation initiation factor 3 subunit B [Vanessa tameamea]